MEPPPGVSEPGVEAPLTRPAAGPGPAVKRLLEQSKPGGIKEVPSAAPESVGKSRRLKWSLLAADAFLLLLSAALLRGVPFISIFWMEWTLALTALSFGAWLAWLAFAD